MMTIKFSKSLTVLSLIFASSFTFAEVYVGGSLGVSEYDIPSKDGTSTSIELRAGYKFNENLAVEGAYVNLGEAESGRSTIGSKYSVDGFNFSLVGTLPVSETIDLYAKGGYMFWEAESELVAGVFSNSTKTDGRDFNLGVGASMAISDNMDVNLQLTRYQFDDVDTDNVSVGIDFAF